MFIATYEHRHGRDTYLCSTEAIAYKTLANLVLNNIDEIDNTDDEGKDFIEQLIGAYRDANYALVTQLYTNDNPREEFMNVERAEVDEWDIETICEERLFELQEELCEGDGDEE